MLKRRLRGRVGRWPSAGTTRFDGGAGCLQLHLALDDEADGVEPAVALVDVGVADDAVLGVYGVVGLEGEDDGVQLELLRRLQVAVGGLHHVTDVDGGVALDEAEGDCAGRVLGLVLAVLVGDAARVVPELARGVAEFEAALFPVGDQVA